jgi:hypothetical protein
MELIENPKPFVEHNNSIKAVKNMYKDYKSHY